MTWYTAGTTSFTIEAASAPACLRYASCVGPVGVASGSGTTILTNDFSVRLKRAASRNRSHFLPFASFNGCPLGLSMIAARGNDEMLLEIARRLSR